MSRACVCVRVCVIVSATRVVTFAYPYRFHWHIRSDFIIIIMTNDRNYHMKMSLWVLMYHFSLLINVVLPTKERQALISKIDN